MYCNMLELCCYPVEIDGRIIWIDRDEAKSQKEAEEIAGKYKPFDLEAYLKSLD